MSGILEYSTTPGSNASINGIGVLGTSAVQNFDNAFRQIMADIASSITRRVAKSANYTALKTDNARFIEFTASATLSLTAAATLTDGWMCIVKANGGSVTIDPSSSEQIDGANTKTIANGGFALVYCNGTAFHTIGTDTSFFGTANTWTAAQTFNVAISMASETSIKGSGPVGMGPSLLRFRDSAGGSLGFVGPDSAISSRVTLFSGADLRLAGSTITMAGPVAITSGSVSGITDLAIADGGTGSSTAAGAFTNLKQAATTTDTGVVEKSTSGENTTGTATDKFPDVAGVKEMIDTFATAKATVTALPVGTVTILYNGGSDVASGTTTSGIYLSLVNFDSAMTGIVPTGLQSGTWKNITDGTIGGNRCGHFARIS